MWSLPQDLRLAARRLLATPGFTLFAIASLAVGIGVSTAVYSALRTFFWAPLGISHPEQVLAVGDGGNTSLAMSWADFEDLRDQQSAFAALSATARLSAAVATGDVREIAFGEAVSGDYFKVTGVGPRLGRLLQPDDDAHAARIVVLSESFWKTRLAADAHIVGRVVKIAGQPYEVAGVAGGNFHGFQPVLPTAFWIPAHAAPVRATVALEWTDRRARQFAVWGRLRPGVDAARANGDVALIGTRLDQAFPRDTRHARRWHTRPAVEVTSNGDADSVGVLIVLGVVAVLLVACTNLANLTLARGTARMQETAVRTALGASRWRLVREQALESTLIAVAGGALGLGVMKILLDEFSVDLPLGPGASLAFRPQADVVVFLAAAAATLLAVLVSGAWPAWQSTHGDIRRSLGAGSSSTPPKWRLHRNLVAWQVAGSVALFLVAAMCSTILGRFEQDDGARYAALAMAEIDFAQNGRSDADARRFLETIQRDLRGRPGIDTVAASDGFPSGILLLFRPMVRVGTPDHPLRGPADAGRAAPVVAATPEFAATAGVRVVRGRWFTEQDTAHSAPVAVVSESLARSLYQTTDVAGRDILAYQSPRGEAAPVPERLTIVGVSEDPPAPGVIRTSAAVLFQPFAQHAGSRDVFLVARGPRPARALAELRAAIRGADPDLALTASGAAKDLLAGPLVTLQMIARLSSALGTLALVLAMAGLFGVLSHVVASRTRELGIRLAIGASRRQIFRLILRDGSSPVLKGLTLGFAIGIALRVILRATIHTTASPVDARLLAMLPLPFALAAFAACYLPAARASRVDPNLALREL